MSRKLVIIRPEPGGSATAEEAQRLGLPFVLEPLFRIEPRRWSPPEPEVIDALLIGSANAVRQGGEALGLFRDKPVYAVGAGTARAAREAGFEVAGTGKGHLQPVLDGLAGRELRLLRVTGEEHVVVTPPPGVRIVTRVVYASVALPVPDRLVRALADSCIVLLHSGVAALHFRAECDRLGVDRSQIAIAALAPRIAEMAGEGWERVETAEMPSDAALLALAQDMCHFAR